MIPEKQSRAFTIFLAIVLPLLGVVLLPQERIEAAAGKEVTITGEVIDSVCYVRMNAKGMDHKECAVKCAKGGIPLALLEEKTGKVYMLASDKEFEGGNVKFQPLEKFVAQKVVIKGKLYEKGGQQLVAISSVEVAK